MTELYAARFARVTQNLAAQGLSQMIVSDPPTIFYLTGIRLNPGERCASTSNRNFEGRQGRGGRTHLVSPAMAAAAAVTGHFADIRNLK